MYNIEWLALFDHIRPKCFINLIHRNFFHPRPPAIGDILNLRVIFFKVKAGVPSGSSMNVQTKSLFIVIPAKPDFIIPHNFIFPHNFCKSLKFLSFPPACNCLLFKSMFNF